jgi:hypothetical protein
MAWKVVPPSGEHPTVTAVFDGTLSAEEGSASATALGAAFRGTLLAVVWDVTHMAGFDGAARSAWAEAEWPTRGQIKSLKVIGAKGMVRVGATYVALLLGKPYEFAAPDDTRVDFDVGPP